MDAMARLERLESLEKTKTEIYGGKFNDETKTCRSSVCAVKFTPHVLASQTRAKKNKPNIRGTSQVKNWLNNHNLNIL